MQWRNLGYLDCTPEKSQKLFPPSEKKSMLIHQNFIRLFLFIAQFFIINGCTGFPPLLNFTHKISIFHPLYTIYIPIFGFLCPSLACARGRPPSPAPLVTPLPMCEQCCLPGSSPTTRLLRSHNAACQVCVRCVQYTPGLNGAQGFQRQKNHRLLSRLQCSRLLRA